MTHLISGPTELRMRIDAIVAHIAEVAGSILVEVYNIHDREHQSDIVSTLIFRETSLIGKFHEATGPGNPLNEPTTCITAALKKLVGADPDLLTEDLGVRFASKMHMAATGLRDFLSAQAGARYATPSARRRDNYAIRQRLIAEKKTPPTPPAAYEVDGDSKGRVVVHDHDHDQKVTR